MLTRHEQFLREKTFLDNSTPATIAWFKHCLKWLPVEQPTAEDLKSMVLRLRESGNKITGCNSVIRGINSYLTWAGLRELHVKRLRCPQTVLPTFTEQQIKLLVHYKPKTAHQKRLHLLVLFLLDTGARITEALTVTVSDVNFCDLLVKLDGKGRRQRLTPFSPELRKALYRHCSQMLPTDRVFQTNAGTLWDKNNVRRNVVSLCTRLGFSAPARTLHAMRHTYATEYLRRGGNVFLLSRSLGHTQISTTALYVHMQTEDLQAMHSRVSLLHR